MKRTTLTKERLPELAVKNTVAASKEIKDAFDVEHLDRFRKEYAKAMTESGNDIGYESIQLAKLCAMAVAQYNGFVNLLPRYQGRRLSSDDTARIERDINDFIVTCERAEMKTLWFNRLCKAFTGRFFFHGRLTKNGQSFRLDDMYGLVHNVFKTIDPADN